MCRVPSNTLAAFAAGLFVATLVLTHDASAGDVLLVARGLLLPSPLPDVEVHASRNASAPDPNVVEGRASDAPEGTKTPYPDDEATDSTRATDATRGRRGVCCGRLARGMTTRGAGLRRHSQERK